jgi:ubiquinone/menaquinone biosynthesis C-methylase UbiE
MNSHWSTYWQQGHLTSFGSSFNVSYSGVLNTIWHSIFEELSDGFSCLDLATGNGALPVIIDQYTTNKSIKGKITAIDIAQINEQAVHKKYDFNSEIRLVSNQSCEQLDSLPGSFDLITSQFGIEYSELAKSLLAAKEKLNKHGKIALVMHHSESEIILRNKRTLELVGSEPFKKCVDSLSGLIGRTLNITSKNDIAKLKADTVAESFRKTINDKMAELSKIDEKALLDSELPNYIQNFMRAGLFGSSTDKNEYIKYVQTQIETLILRLKELTDAAISTEEMSKLEAYCHEHNLSKVSVEEIRGENNTLFAWFLVLKHS